MYNSRNNESAGMSYDDMNWYDVVGQPFGTAAYFNAIIFGDADNIVDTKGAMAIGGNFTSSRGLSLGYGNDGNLTGTGYNPDSVRFLVGNNVAIQGPLVVIGHVMSGGNFRAGRGSTYMIGKDGSNNQSQELTALYQADGGSKYWALSDRGTHYAVSSYDVPRFIPANRVNADVRKFFMEADESISGYHDCIINMQPNGTVTEHYHEWILRGNDPRQNVFLIDVSPNGVLDKEIRFEVPQGSVSVVILRTGDNAHLKYGLWGNEALASRTLYVFEDANNIYMEVPAAIWGSILAPQAKYYANKSGGTVSGNAALGALEVSSASGFEFHLYPFVGGVVCGSPVEELPTEENTLPEQEQMPEQMQTPPAPIPIPAPAPCPTPAPCPQAAPCPTCPTPAPCPQAAPCPTCPTPQLCPEAAPCPTCPTPQPCPTCPIPAPCPQAAPCPMCPTPPPCPSCPECEKSITRIEIQPVPIPIPIPCPPQEDCEECEDCMVIPGMIYGCIWGCSCCKNHEWEIKLYRSCGEKKMLIECIRICCCGCFQFDVPYDDFYLLQICPVISSSHRHSRKSSECKPVMTLKNVGVANLMIE